MTNLQFKYKGMKKRNLLVGVLMFGGGLIALKSNAQFTLSGEITPRTELRNGFKKPIVEGQDAALFTEQRTRLHFGYKEDAYEFKVSLQDVRTWGAVNQIFKSDPSLQNINQAWAKYKFGASSIKVGRMELDYDNARFMGNLGWAMQSRSHDLALYEYKSDSTGFTFHLGAGFNQDADTPEFRKLTSTYFSGANNKTMQYAWLNKKFDKGSFSLLVHNNGVQALDFSDTTSTDTTTVKFIQTVGGVLKLKASDKVSIGAETYYQFGKTGSDLTVGAMYLDLHAAIKAGKTTVAIGGEFLTGDEAGDDKWGAFNPMYGTNHKFNGFMDYFYVGNGHGNVGLINPYVKAKFKTGDKSLLLAHAHGFLSQQDIGDNYLGSELDLVYVNKLSQGVVLKVGMSGLIASDSMKGLKGVPTDTASSFNTWSWVQIIFKPKFL